MQRSQPLSGRLFPQGAAPSRVEKCLWPAGVHLSVAVHSHDARPAKHRDGREYLQQPAVPHTDQPSNANQLKAAIETRYSSQDISGIDSLKLLARRMAHQLSRRSRVRNSITPPIAKIRDHDLRSQRVSKYVGSVPLRGYAGSTTYGNDECKADDGGDQADCARITAA